MQLVSALPPGTILGNEKYKILGVCGQGGFGITYAGWDFSLERNVAVKECFPQEICERDSATAQIRPRMPELQEAYLAAMADLQREARLLAQLNHPGIVQVHDVFASGGSLFCVMHWLEGDTLRAVLDAAEAADEPLPHAESEAWLRRILDALTHMHAHGIIHRDIKPANIMFDDAGRPVLVDFGSAVNISRLTHTLSQGPFSAASAAPEQISGKGEIGPWTDFYSLAATWYEVFSNCAPEETVRRMMDDGLVPLESLVPQRVQEAPHLAAGIMRNLRLKAAERCQSAADWLTVLGGKRQPRRPLRKGRRRPWLWAAAAGVAAALGFLTVPLFMREKTPPPPPEEVREGEPDIDALTDRAWEYYKLAELVEIRKRFVAENQDILTRYREQYSGLADRCKATPAEDLDGDAAQSEFKQFSEAAGKELKALGVRYREEFLTPYEKARKSLEGGIGWPGLTTAEKLALMHAVSSRINTRMVKECGSNDIYAVDLSGTFDALKSQWDWELHDILLQAGVMREEERSSRKRAQREEQEKQGKIDRAKNVEALYKKVHEQSGLVGLIQEAEKRRAEYGSMPAEGVKAFDAIVDQALAKAQSSPETEFSIIQSGLLTDLLACKKEHGKKMDAFREDYRREVEWPLREIVKNCGSGSEFPFVTDAEKKLLGDIKSRIRAEAEPYEKLPQVKAPDHDDAYSRFSDSMRDLGERREKERAAAVKALYGRVVDGKKLESLVARRRELGQRRTAMHEACEKETAEYEDRVVPQIKAKPRKEWDAAIRAAEQGVQDIEYSYMQRDEQLVEESKKVASVARSYLDRIKHGKGSEFSGLLEEEKKLLPEVERLAWESLGGGYFSTNVDVTVPMMEGWYYGRSGIGKRVYEGVDTDALQEEAEAETMEELGL